MRRGQQKTGQYVCRAASFARRAGVAGFTAGLMAIALCGASDFLGYSSLPSWIAPAQAGNDDWQKQNWEEEREARRQRREAEREARRQRREAEEDAKRQKQEAEQEAKRQQQEAEQEAKRQQQEAEQEAKRQQRELQQEARRQRSEIEQEARNRPRTQTRHEFAGKDDDESGRRQGAKSSNDDKPTREDKSSNDDRSSDKESGKSSANTNANNGDKPPSEGNSNNKPGTAASVKPVQSSKSSAQNKAEKAGDDEKPLPPPKTVLEMLERAVAPEKPKPKPQPPPAAAVTTAKSAPAAKPEAVKAANKIRPAPAVRRSVPDFELLEQGMFRPHEILATNLTPEEQQFAEANGFKSASTVATPGETGTVSSLIVPPGMTETAALQFLERAAPSAQFGPNHVYRIIPAADGPVPAAARDGVATADSAAKGRACTAGDCFARELLAWKPATKQCARRVRIGIIDTSFDVSHPAFQGRKFSLEQFSGNQAIARGDWHGTAVLSVLAGNASSSTPGLIPDADFFLASTFRADAQGNAAADTISVLKALAWLDKRKVNIVNMSFSGPQNDQIEAAIAAMAAKGVVFVAAAGNKGPSAPPSYPAAYSQVVAVTAVSKKLNSYPHANRGDYVDVAAPGVQVLTALPEGRQGYRTGTSFATPFVTGLLAAMPAVRKGAADKVEMLSRISFQDLGEPGRDAIYGEGLPKAPERCNDIGGVASLPWTNAAKRMSVGAPTPAESALARPASQ